MTPAGPMTPGRPGTPGSSGTQGRPGTQGNLGTPGCSATPGSQGRPDPVQAAPRRTLAQGRLWSLLLAALAVLALALACQRGLTAWQAERANRLIDAGETVDRAPAEVVFAHALALERRGRHDDALNAYAEAEVLGDERLRHAVRVNVANLYLRRGIAAASDEGNAQRAMVLIQLAKAGYRRALRDDPDDWNARYNFELALRILPDLEVRNWRRSGSESEIEEHLKQEKSAWAEMVGQPRGMH